MQNKTASAKTAAPEKEHSIHIIRLFDAPRKMVWKAWTDRKQAAKWWGPRGFTITTHSKELKNGGHWDYTMHGPDGTDYPNLAKYHEVVEFSKLVYDHGGTRDKPPLFRVTVLFSDVGNKTKMDMTMTVDSPEALKEIKEVIKKASGNSTWDRLAEYLEKEESGKEKFVINRSFDAPIDMVYKMWTEPKHFCQWMGPAGASMQIIRGEIKPGGSLFYAMPFGGITMYGRVKYVSIEKPHRITYKQQFCDKDENVARHPMSPTWPETMLTVVEFAEEGPDKTRVTVTWEPAGKATRTEIDTFVTARSGMTQGWTGSFDKLEAYLEKA